MALIMLGLYLFSYLALLNEQNQPPVRRRFVDPSAFMDMPFMILCLASIFSATAFYIPLLYLPLLTRARIPTIDENLEFDLLAILNGASAVGRLLAGVTAAKFGSTETIAATLVLGSILLFSWIAVSTVAGTIVWAIFWGMISGILVTLPGAFIPLFCPSLAVIGTRSGMYWLAVGLGLLIGCPIGGAIYDFKTVRMDWWRLQIFAGVFMLAAAGLTIYPIMTLRRKARAQSF